MAFGWRVDSGRINIFWESDRNVLATQKYIEGESNKSIVTDIFMRSIVFIFFVPFYDVHFPSNIH